MWQLILASLLWAVSYSFNKQTFTGTNPFISSFIFCASSSVIFVPLLKTRALNGVKCIKLMLIGAVELGLMSIFFQSSFFFLDAHEVAILMITTPMYIVLIGGIFDRRALALPFFLACVCVMLSFGILNVNDYSFDYQGVILSQLANASFACGQILLKQFFLNEKNANLLDVMCLLYAGGGIICAAFSLVTLHLNYDPFTGKTFAYACLMGIICCGFCNYLWNIGAIRVSVPLLAVMNNAQIPFAVLVSVVFFHEKIQPGKILCCLLMLGVILTISILYKIFNKDQGRA